MKSLLVLSICTALTGCASYLEVKQRHPVVTRVVEGSLLLSCGVTAAKLLGNKDAAHRFGDQPRICDTKPEACR